jgi:hypothetical protein
MVLHSGVEKPPASPCCAIPGSACRPADSVRSRPYQANAVVDVACADFSKGRGEPRVHRLFCKPICKPDVAKQAETAEKGPSERDVFRFVRRDHPIRERLPETSETCIVVLITQRSQVQILPPLQRCRSEAPSSHGRGLLHVVCKRRSRSSLLAGSRRPTGPGPRAPHPRSRWRPGPTDDQLSERVRQVTRRAGSGACSARRKSGTCPRAPTAMRSPRCESAMR